MGRNNRQRRAKKQKARTRRGPTTAASHSPHGGWTPDARAEQFAEEAAEELAEMFGGLLDDLFDGDPSGATFLDPPPRRTPTERAQQLLDRWLTTARRHNDAAVLKIWAEQQLRSIEPTVLARVDELLGHRLLADVAGLWNAGWQPRDLLHVAQRIDRRAAAVAADLAVEQLRRSGRLDLAPDAWREQLDSAAAHRTTAGLPGIGDGPWTPLRQLTFGGANGAEAVSSVLRLVVRIEQLPRIAATLPPPSAWRSASSFRRAGSETPPRPGTAGAPASTMDGRRDKVLATVRGLLAKAESTDHQAEAEALTAKAQDLMTRHAIDEALLQAAADEAIDVRSHRVLIDSPYPSEKVRLLTEVGRANRVRVIWLDGLSMATVVGTPVDVDQTELLFVSLLIQATRAMAEAGAVRAGSFDRSPSFRRAFLTSYAIRIGERLTEADRAATSSYGAELVPVLKRQQEAVDDEFDRLFPDTYQLNARRSYNRRGWDAGRDAADDAVFVAGSLAG